MKELEDLLLSCVCNFSKACHAGPVRVLSFLRPENNFLVEEFFLASRFLELCGDCLCAQVERIDKQGQPIDLAVDNSVTVCCVLCTLTICALILSRFPANMF